MKASIANDKKLLMFIQYIPLALMVLFTLVIIAVLVKENHLSLDKDINSLRENFYSSQQKKIQNRVNNVVEQIEFEKKRTEALLKQDVKQRVEEALDIANNLHQQYQHLDPDTAKAMILEALRPIRFNQGRGYFFVYQLDGTNVMHPILPNIQGQNLWDLKDEQGSYVIRDLANIARHQKSGFHRWSWNKPEALDQEFDKIGYVAHFKPYDWFIGTGEYVVDVETDIQERLLERISDYRYENNDYVFILNSKGALLSHPNPNLIGVERLDATDKSGVKYIQTIVDKAASGGGFVRYHSSYTPLGSEDSYKLSFVNYLSDWDWVVGTGVYLKPVEDFLISREQQIIESNQRELQQITLASVLICVTLALMSLVMGKRVGLRYSTMQKQISRDFNRLEAAKSRLQYQALHDSLTNLPNRLYLEQFIQETIQNATQDKPLTAIMFVDIDDFKKVNDAFGHSIGDQMLADIAHQFSSLLEDNQIVARFGGDEFVFCFPQLSCVLDAENLAKKITQVFKQEMVIEGKVISSSCSVGVSIYPQDGLNPEELITRADTALYTSKARRKGRVLFFDESLNKRVQYELTLEKELRNAIKNEELYMHFQPQTNLQTGETESVEALLRWHNPQLGQVSPVELIRKAEEIGLIHSIGSFVIQHACQQIVTHFPDDASELGLSINISPSQLMAKGFVDELTRIVDEQKISRHRITVEITENVLIDDLELVTPILNLVRERGFAVSLDDFGTGFSSLSYLCNLPISEIKIDRSFVDMMLVNKQSDALVKAIIAIGKAHKMKVVAEGIETKEQYKQLLEYDCNLGQGYYYAKPLSIEDFIEHCNTNRVE